jgi:topoisomerase IV subunit A
VRALKGHVQESDDIKYKEGDRGRFLLHAETTDKLLVFGTNGRFYTIGVDKLPGGRGHGEPIRLMIELGNDQDIVALLVHKPGRKLVVASHDGRGFIVPEEEVVAQTRTGKQVLNLAEGVEAAACAPVEGDHVAVMGENRKMIIFPVAELPEMTRGRGVILQKYKDGGLSDVKTFNLAEGLTWRLGDKTRTEIALKDWVGQRAQAGRLPPRGFPTSNKFD